MTHDEMIAILVAHRDGRKIQARLKSTGPASEEWAEYDYDTPPTSWDRYEYRIKPGMVCKTRLQVRGGHFIYIEGGPQAAELLETNYARYLFGQAPELAGLPPLDKEPREEFELKPA